MSACDIQEDLFSTEEKESLNGNNTVQLLSRLKKKLVKIDPNAYFIENCYGLGYRISPTTLHPYQPLS